MPAYTRPLSFFRVSNTNIPITDLESNMLMTPKLSGPCERLIRQWRGCLNGLKKLDEKFARFRRAASMKAATNKKKEEKTKKVVDEETSESEVDNASSDTESDATSAGVVDGAEDIKVDAVQDPEEPDVLVKFRNAQTRGSQFHQIFESRYPSVIPHIVISSPEDNVEADTAFKAQSPKLLIEQELGYLLPLIPYEAYSLMNDTYKAMESEPQAEGAQWEDSDMGSQETSDEYEMLEGEDELNLGERPDRPVTPSHIEGSEGRYLPSLVADESDESDEDEDGPPDMATDPWFVKEMARQAALKAAAC